MTGIMNIHSSTEKLSTAGRPTRRQVLKQLGLGAVGLSSMSFLAPRARANAASPGILQDISVLQFALNLEYLEAEYYTYAVTGHGIEQEGVDVTGQGRFGMTSVKPNPQVPFADPDVQQYAAEIAQDERNHVIFIRAALNALGVEPVARPAINLNDSWDTLAQAAGLVPPGGTFNPFENDLNFLLGSFVFEDVGVTAYHGAAALLSNGDILTAAAGILAVEAYHAGIIREELFGQHSDSVNMAVQQISDLRDALDNPIDDDQGITANGSANLVPTDSNGVAYARTAQEVLNIVYFAQDVSAGGFFPNGINAGSASRPHPTPHPRPTPR